MFPLVIIPVLVQSCHDGLRLMPDTLTSVRQQEGMHLYTNGFLAASQWCNHDLTQCVEDQWQGCPIEECTHVWVVYACAAGFCEDRVIVQSTPGIAVTFVSTNPDGILQSGAWCGPADWTLDGVMDSRDFFAFVDDMLKGTADHDRSGATDSTDFFVFISDFFGS